MDKLTDALCGLLSERMNNRLVSQAYSRENEQLWTKGAKCNQGNKLNGENPRSFAFWEFFLDDLWGFPWFWCLTWSATGPWSFLAFVSCWKLAISRFLVEEQNTEQELQVSSMISQNLGFRQQIKNRILAELMRLPAAWPQVWSAPPTIKEMNSLYYLIIVLSSCFSQQLSQRKHWNLFLRLAPNVIQTAYIPAILQPKYIFLRLINHTSMSC